MSGSLKRDFTVKTANIAESQRITGNEHIRRIRDICRRAHSLLTLDP